LHLNNQVFERFNFGDLNPDAKTDVDQVNFSGIAEESIVSWDMLPGDRPGTSLYPKIWS